MQDIEATDRYSSASSRKGTSIPAHITKASTTYVLTEITTARTSSGYGDPEYAGEGGKGQGDDISDIPVTDRKPGAEI